MRACMCVCACVLSTCVYVYDHIIVYIRVDSRAIVMHSRFHCNTINYFSYGQMYKRGLDPR